MSKTVGLIRESFADVNFDVVLINNVVFDRESFISVTSEELGEHETITLETNEATMHFNGSTLERVVKAKEPKRGLFREYVADEGIDEIIVEYKFDFHRQPTIIQRNDIVSINKSKYSNLTLIVETTSTKHEIDFTQVSSVTAIKRET